MLNRSSIKSKLVINAILLALGAVLYVGLWYGIGYISNATAVEHAKLLEAQDVLERAEKIQKALSGSQEIQDEVNSRFLTGDEVVGFIESLENLAHTIGLEQNTDAVNDVAYLGLDIKKWGGLQVVLSVKGPWRQVYQFLSLLEHLPYQSKLTRAVIEKELLKQSDDLKVVSKEDWKGEFTLQVLKRK